MRTLYSIIACLFILAICVNSVAQCDGRYQTEIFDSIVVTTVQYGESYNSSGEFEELFLDVYEPYGDVETHRPLILLAHGGAFLEVATRKSGDIRRLCETMASWGYVCASYDYRLEMNPIMLGFPEHMIKAIFRGIQDGKAAIRYFKRSAGEDNSFNIDPNQIIVGGVSAGAILALNLVYVTDFDMLPWPWDAWVQQIGGLEGNSGNPGYNEDVRGIINLSGAMVRPNWINGNDIPMLHVHGTLDPIVPFSAGRPFGIPTLPKLYGSRVIHTKALERGIPSTLIKFTGLGHTPFLNLDNFITGESFFNAEIWDSTVLNVRDFAWSLLDCNPDNQVVTGVYNDVSAEVGIYPNPSSGPFKITVPSELTNAHIEVISIDGSEILNVVMTGAEMDINLSLPPGIYSVRLSPLGSNGTAFHKRLIVAY